MGKLVLQILHESQAGEPFLLKSLPQERRVGS